MSLTKREIALRVADKLGIIQPDAQEAVQATIDIICEELAKGGHIELRGFGVFEVAERKSRVGRNPNNPKSQVMIPARKVIKFRAGKELAAAVKDL